MKGGVPVVVVGLGHTVVEDLGGGHLLLGQGTGNDGGPVREGRLKVELHRGVVNLLYLFDLVVAVGRGPQVVLILSALNGGNEVIRLIVAPRCST